MSQGYQPGNRRFLGSLTFLAQTLNLRYQVPEALRSLVELAGEQRGAPAPSLGSTQPVITEPSESGLKLDICADVYAPEIHVWVITKALLKQLRGEVEASGAQFKLWNHE